MGSRGSRYFQRNSGRSPHETLHHSLNTRIMKSFFEEATLGVPAISNFPSAAMTYSQPLLLVLAVLALCGLVRLRACRKRGLIGLAVAGFLLVSWPPVDWLFSRPLQAPFRPRPMARLVRPQAVVVLSSSVSPPHSWRPYPMPDQETFERCAAAARAYEQWQPIPVLVCGGGALRNQPAYSVTMRELLKREGVPENMIWTEERSQSTHENALFGTGVLRLLNVQRIALVVDAQSMRRAAACFRKEGIDVVPAVSSFREWDGWSQEWIPSWEAIRQNERTLHEVLGLGWYWVRGWI